MNEDLSTQLKEARTKLNLTQAQAAELWKIPLATLKGWESGQLKPRNFSLPSLHQLLPQTPAEP